MVAPVISSASTTDMRLRFFAPFVAIAAVSVPICESYASPRFPVAQSCTLWTWSERYPPTAAAVGQNRRRAQGNARVPHSPAWQDGRAIGSGGPHEGVRAASGPSVWRTNGSAVSYDIPAIGFRQLQVGRTVWNW